jgi:hypothetical protein
MQFEARKVLFENLRSYFDGDLQLEPLGVLQSSSLKRFIKGQIFSLEGMGVLSLGTSYTEFV